VLLGDHVAAMFRRIFGLSTGKPRPVFRTLGVTNAENLGQLSGANPGPVIDDAEPQAADSPTISTFTAGFSHPSTASTALLTRSQRP